MGVFAACGRLFVAAPLAVVCRLSGAWVSMVEALEHWLSSCGVWLSLLHGVWGLPTPGIKPMSRALAGGLSTTRPPGRPHPVFKKLSLKDVRELHSLKQYLTLCLA